MTCLTFKYEVRNEAFAQFRINFAGVKVHEPARQIDVLQFERNQGSDTATPHGFKCDQKTESPFSPTRTSRPFQDDRLASSRIDIIRTELVHAIQGEASELMQEFSDPTARFGIWFWRLLCGSAQPVKQQTYCAERGPTGICSPDVMIGSHRYGLTKR